MDPHILVRSSASHTTYDGCGLCRKYEDTMEHAHRLIIVCDHIMGRPDVLWIESGQVQAAVCSQCAESVDAGGEPAALKPLCVTCARIENIPTDAKRVDGFYAWLDGQWVRTGDVS